MKASSELGDIRDTASSEQLITLVSREGKEFQITMKEARCSEMLASMLKSDWRDSAARRVNLDSISTEILDIVVKVCAPLASRSF